MSLVLLAAAPAKAATVMTPDAGARFGAPVAQTFLDGLGENVSLLSTDTGVSCVASQILPIAESEYLAPDGSKVDFADVRRSPASSVQAIARPGGQVSFRVQLKFSPDPAQPITLRIADRSLDVASALESSSDSLWLTDDTARMLADALRRGDRPTLRAISQTSGRAITDRIPAPDMAGLEACLVTLKDLLAAQQVSQTDGSNPAGVSAVLPETDRSADRQTAVARTGIVPVAAPALVLLPSAPSEPVLSVPVTGLRLEFVARPDPGTRIAPAVLKDCRMSDIPERVYLGRLSSVTGFFSQTQDVYVAFDDAGTVQRAYIPGIFDSALSAGTGRAHVSIAADSNLPDQPNRVKGCLGDALLEASVCSITETGDGRHTVAECGVLGMSETREDDLAYLWGLDGSDFGGPDPLVRSMRPGNEDPVGPGAGMSRPSFAGFGGGWGGGGGSGARGGVGSEGVAWSGVGRGEVGAQGIAHGGTGFPDGDGLAAALSGPGGNSAFGDPDWDSPDLFTRTEGRRTPPAGSDVGTDIPQVPLPGAFWLALGTLTGVSGLAAMLRRRKDPV